MGYVGPAPHSSGMKPREEVTQCRRALLSGRNSNSAEGKWGETLT